MGCRTEANALPVATQCSKFASEPTIKSFNNKFMFIKFIEYIEQEAIHTFSHSCCPLNWDRNTTFLDDLSDTTPEYTLSTGSDAKRPPVMI